MPNIRKIFFCKICNKIHNCHGFCKYHAWAFIKKFIDINGVPLKGFYFNDEKKIRKEKNTLSQTVKESKWYREWRRKILEKYNRHCSKCGRGNIKLIVHHEKKKFSQIIKKAKEFNDIHEQIKYCKEQHTIEIGKPLCMKCHAESHIGEKMYASLSGKLLNGKCKVCMEDVYCRQFCSKHYRAFLKKRIDINGKILIPDKLFKEKQSCIICKKESIGRGGIKAKFCRLHHSRYYNGFIDKDGQTIHEPRLINFYKKCKICNEKHYGRGFCLTHYNHFKIGQIDINGQKLRELRPSGVNFSTVFIEFNNKKLSIKNWAETIGISRNSMAKRLKKWTIEKALTTPKIECGKNNEHRNTKKI